MIRRNTTIFTSTIRELGLQNDEVEIKTKASEFQKEVDRKIDAKLMTNWPSCKPVLCIHISCEMLGIPFDKRSIVKLASTTEQNYYSSLSYIKKVLGISTLTFDLLATRFECPKTLPYLENMFETFKENWTQDLTNANIEAIDWNDSVYIVAIFWCVCKTFGCQSQITPQDLIDLPEVTITRTELNKYTRLVEKHCKSYITVLKSQKKFVGRRIAFKKPIPLKKRSKRKIDDEKKAIDGDGEGEDETKVIDSSEDKTINVGDKKRNRKRKFQDEDDESINRKHKEDETKVEKNPKSIDKGKRRAIEPEEEYEENQSCIGPMILRGEMKIVNYWETQLYKDYLDWRESIMQKISEKISTNSECE